MRSVSWLISARYALFDLHQKALEFRCVRIRVINRRRKRFASVRASSFVLGVPPEAMVDLESNLVTFAIDQSSA